MIDRIARSHPEQRRAQGQRGGARDQVHGVDPRIRHVRAGGAAAWSRDAFGTLAIIFNAMSFLAVIAPCGQETLIVRSWDEYLRDRPPGARARRARVRRAGHVRRRGSLIATIVARRVAVLGSRDLLASPLVLAACAFLLLQALHALQRAVLARGRRRDHRRDAARDPVAAHRGRRHRRASGAADAFTTIEFFISAAGAIMLVDRASAVVRSRALPRAVTAAEVANTMSPPGFRARSGCGCRRSSIPAASISR